METALTLVQNGRISTIQQPINESLAVILARVYVAAGQNMPSFEFPAIVENLDRDIRANFSQLTLEEVEHALNLGIRGEMTERTDINNGTLFQWLKHWKNSQDRMAAIKMARDNTTKALPAKGEGHVSYEERWQSSVRHALDTFETYKERQMFWDFGNAAYFFLASIGLISYTVERKKEIFVQARASLIRGQQQVMASSGTAWVSRDAKRIIEQLTNTDRHADVISEARRLALKIYFDNLIEMDEDLNLLITETKTEK